MGFKILKKSWIFPGQASQKVGMGLDLYENTDLGKKYYDLANDILGVDIKNISFNGPDEKLKITKIAWETKGARSVRNDIKIKEKFNFKQSAKDILITTQLRTALIVNKNVKATNYQIDTYKKKIYVYGIALTSEEKDLVVSEAKEILDVENVIASIILVEDLRIQKD